MEVAKDFEKRHDNILQDIQKLDASDGFRLLNFQETRLLTFEMLVTNKKGQPLRYCFLDEEQATFLITLLRNSDPVVHFKRRLTGEFYRMRSEITKDGFAFLAKGFTGKDAMEPKHVCNIPCPESPSAPGRLDNQEVP
ncbi:MAG: Rha family transcriptional regulator [Pseudomonadota bacterium]